MVAEMERPKETQEKLVLPVLALGPGAESAKAVSNDTITTTLLDRMMGRGTDQIETSRDLTSNASGDVIKTVFQGVPIPSEKETKSIQDTLANQLTEKYKDLWNLLPKESRDSILKLQEAALRGDLKQLGELAKSLKPETAEKMAELIEKNLREAGAGVHLKSADGRFLLYCDGAKCAVLIGKDGKASVVPIEPNEPAGPPEILEGKKPFKSSQSLAKEIADAAITGIKLGNKNVDPPKIPLLGEWAVDLNLDK
jgi:hypothetical protein